MNVFGFQKYSLSLSKPWPGHEDGQRDLLSPGQPLGCGHFRRIIRCCLWTDCFRMADSTSGIPFSDRLRKKNNYYSVLFGFKFLQCEIAIAPDHV